jgi:hypothetical protein
MNPYAQILRNFAANYLALHETQRPILAAAEEIERLEAALSAKEKECQRLRSIIYDCIDCSKALSRSDRLAKASLENKEANEP